MNGLCVWKKFTVCVCVRYFIVVDNVRIDKQYKHDEDIGSYFQENHQRQSLRNNVEELHQLI